MELQFKTPETSQPLDEYILQTVHHHNNSNNHEKSIFFTPGEVRSTILDLKNRSAPGPDSISNNALKHCSLPMFLHLTKLLNGCARLEYFPNQWKQASIIMLPKPGKCPTIPINHRPISLLNTLSKVFERLLLTRLNFHTSHKIRPEQYGFRRQHSTTLQLVNVLDEIITKKNHRLKTVAVLLDVEKAFDKVWHPGLIFKLIALGIPAQLVNIIKSFLNNRQFYIKMGLTHSSVKPIEAGVPQGSCLSPQLFAIYINDLPLLSHSKIALFADDTLFYTSCTSTILAVKKLQNQLNHALPWFDQWRISINTTKTSAIHFSKKCISKAPKLKIKNTFINWSPSIKYLGVQIDNNLKFHKHVNMAVNKTKAVGYKLFPLLNEKSPLSIRTKLYIYKTYMRPILTYASPAWISNISTKSRNKLEATQSIALRKITGLPWYVSNQTIRQSTNIPSISQHMSSASTILAQSISTSTFKHISDISKRKNSSRTVLRNRPIKF